MGFMNRWWLIFVARNKKRSKATLEEVEKARQSSEQILEFYFVSRWATFRLLKTVPEPHRDSARSDMVSSYAGSAGSFVERLQIPKSIAERMDSFWVLWICNHDAFYLALDRWKYFEKP
ncbi:hypothetical protein PQX77_019631 [Marasmius sp. AFHP31]|nr:hypothetical protein PQX77_019631 [Marasmius sp. AFHP31]